MVVYWAAMSFLAAGVSGTKYGTSTDPGSYFMGFQSGMTPDSALDPSPNFSQKGPYCGWVGVTTAMRVMETNIQQKWTEMMQDV